MNKRKTNIIFFYIILITLCNILIIEMQHQYYKIGGRFCYGPSLLWAEIVWAELVMGRVCHGPSLLWAELSSYQNNTCNSSVHAHLSILKHGTFYRHINPLDQ